MHSTAEINAVINKAKQQRADYIGNKLQGGTLPLAVALAAVISLAFVSFPANRATIDRAEPRRRGQHPQRLRPPSPRRRCIVTSRAGPPWSTKGLENVRPVGDSPGDAMGSDCNGPLAVRAAERPGTDRGLAGSPYHDRASHCRASRGALDGADRPSGQPSSPAPRNRRVVPRISALCLSRTRLLRAAGAER